MNSPPRCQTASTACSRTSAASRSGNACIRANDFARFAICGLIASYEGAPTTISDIRVILTKRLKIEGFIVSRSSASVAAGARRTRRARRQRQAALSRDRARGLGERAAGAGRPAARRQFRQDAGEAGLMGACASFPTKWGRWPKAGWGVESRKVSLSVSNATFCAVANTLVTHRGGAAPHDQLNRQSALPPATPHPAFGHLPQQSWGRRAPDAFAAFVYCVRII